MKAIHKWVSVMLISAMLTSITVPALAYSNGEMGNFSENVMDAELSQTECEDVYKVEGTEQYVLKVAEDTYQLVNQLEVNVKSFEKNQDMFEIYGISDNIIDDIKQTIAEQSGNSNLEIYIYTPVNASSNARRADTKDEIVEYRNCSTGYVTFASGEETKDICEALFNLYVGAVGLVSKSVSIIGTGLSVLSAFGEEVVTGSPTDKSQINLIYDKLEKYTSVYMSGNGWVPGCKSYKVWLNRGTVYQYYADNAREKYTNTNYNEVMYSESYNNADEVALDNYLNNMWIDNPLQFTIESLTVDF